MIFLILNIVSIPSLWLSNHLFKRWINPLSVYTVVWYLMINFYHMKLINYVDLSWETWFVIIASYLSLLLGIITYYSAIGSFYIKRNSFQTRNKGISILFLRDGKILFWLSLTFGIIGLFSAFHTLYVILSMYSSIFETLLHLGEVYQMRVKGELNGVIPYLSVFVFASIFFSASYSAFNNKIKLVVIIPLIALIIKQIALASRASILLGFLEFIFTFVFTLYYLQTFHLFKRKNNRLLIVQFLIMFLLFILSIVAVKNLRGAGESFAGETRSLKVQDSAFLSPSIYLYLSGHLGVLNQYLEKSNETSKIGQNTFLFAYNFVSKFGITERPNGYQKPYHIPVWINTGTYIRELIADFSFPGALVVIFLFSFLVTFFWERFFSYSDFKYLVLLVFFVLILAMSFLTIITRLANWVLSLGFILFVIWAIERFLKKRILQEKLN